MRSAELLAFDVEGTLEGRLATWAQDHGLWFRPVQHAAALLNLLRKGSRGMLLVRVGRDVLGEIQIVRDVARDFPEVRIVAFSEIDQPMLEGLAYDLGAAAVVFPPRGVDDLFEFLARWRATDGSKRIA